MKISGNLFHNNVNILITSELDTQKMSKMVNFMLCYSYDEK